MFYQALRSEIEALQSLPFHPFTGRCIHSGHYKREFHAVILNAAIFRYFPMDIGETSKEAGHHGMNGRPAFVFAEVSGVIGGIIGEQGFNEWEIMVVGQGHVVFCQFNRFLFTRWIMLTWTPRG